MRSARALRQAAALLPDGPVLSRTWNFRDGNHLGRVHGGQLLKMIEMAGSSAVTSHLAGSGVGVMARIESLSFDSAVNVGETSNASGTLVYTSLRSALVSVEVRNDAGELSNTASVWYVGVKDGSCGRGQPFVAEPMPAVSTPGSAAGQALYEARRADADDLAARHAVLSDSARLVAGPGEPDSPTSAATQLAQMMLPADTLEAGPGGNGLVSGGKVLKKMDTCAGLCAIRYSGQPSVTVGIDAINLTAPIYMGDVLSLQARPTFCSARSLEIAVSAYAETPSDRNRRPVAEGLFTFVAIDDDGRPLPQPRMLLETEGDVLRFSEGAARYKQRRAARRGS